MRGTFLTFILLLSFTGCIGEDRSGCDTFITLTFLYGDNPGEFDDAIGNNVYVHLYKDDRICRTIEIPYHEIRGGKKFRLNKSFDGGFSLAAWAVPAVGGKEEMIPTAEEHPVFSGSTIEYKNRIPDDYPHCRALDDLFLGIVRENRNDIAPESHYVVSMKSALCKVKVIADPELFRISSPDDKPNIHVRGTAEGENLDLMPFGEEVCVKADLDQEAEYGMIASARLGIMPAYNQKPISVSGYNGDVKAFTVDTGELSVAGKEMTILISGFTADILVNGWKVKTTSVVFN